MAGVPVYSRQGRGGGWQLVGGARTDLSGLTAAEARALFLVAGTASSTPEVKAALRKLVRALPEPFRPGRGSRVERRSWSTRPPGAGPQRRHGRTPEHLEALQQAVVEGEQVELGYVGPDQAADDAHRAPARARVEEGRLVPGRRHRGRAAHVPGRPGHRGRAHRRRGRAARGIRPRRGLAARHRHRRRALERGARPRRGVVRTSSGCCGTCSGTRVRIGPSRPDGRIEVEIGGRERTGARVGAGRVRRRGRAARAAGRTREHLLRIGTELAATYRT